MPDNDGPASAVGGHQRLIADRQRVRSAQSVHLLGLTCRGVHERSLEGFVAGDRHIVHERSQERAADARRREADEADALALRRAEQSHRRLRSVPRGCALGPRDELVLERAAAACDKAHPCDRDAVVRQEQSRLRLVVLVRREQQPTRPARGAVASDSVNNDGLLLERDAPVAERDDERALVVDGDVVAVERRALILRRDDDAAAGVAERRLAVAREQMSSEHIVVELVVQREERNPCCARAVAQRRHARQQRLARFGA
eukprot:Amastigsp_a508346_21.p3 type:complete len:259 gc:universal Amastigsp_a508346_21:931-155(-)